MSKHNFRKKHSPYSWAREPTTSDEEDEDEEEPDDAPCYRFTQDSDGNHVAREMDPKEFHDRYVSRNQDGSPKAPSESTADGKEDDGPPQVIMTEADAGKGTCQLFYERNGNCKKRLLVMCWGIKDSAGRKLGETDDEPYKNCQGRKKILPTKQVMHEEIVRRAKEMGCGEGQEPKCANWNKQKSKDWLMVRPVTKTEDVTFLVTEEAEFVKVLSRAKAETSSKTGVNKTTAAWTTNEPWLRLISAACHDESRFALLYRDNVMEAAELDAKNSSSRPETYEEVVARLFNDENRTYITCSLPDLHHAFASPIELRFEDMPGPVTPEEVKSRLADARAKLIKIINKWELSGNGFGQRGVNEDGEGFEEGFGVLDDRHYHAGDNRSNFLGTFKEYLLYMWEMFLRVQILDVQLSVLSKEVAFETEDDTTALTDDALGNESTKKKRKKAEQLEEEHRQFRQKFGSAMTFMSYSAMLENLRDTKKTIVEYKLRAITTSDPTARKAIEDFIKTEEAAAADLEKKLEAIGYENED